MDTKSELRRAVDDERAALAAIPLLPPLIAIVCEYRGMDIRVVLEAAGHDELYVRCTNIVIMSLTPVGPESLYDFAMWHGLDDELLLMFRSADIARCPYLGHGIERTIKVAPSAAPLDYVFCHMLSSGYSAAVAVVKHYIGAMVWYYDYSHWTIALDLFRGALMYAAMCDTDEKFMNAVDEIEWTWLRLRRGEDYLKHIVSCAPTPRGHMYIDAIVAASSRFYDTEIHATIVEFAKGWGGA